MSQTPPNIFTQPLDQIPQAADGVPSFLPVVRDYIISHAATEGIFRKCGCHTLVQDLGIIFACPQVAIPPSCTVFEVIGFLKQWLNQLPDPIISPDTAIAFLRNSSEARSAVETMKHLRVLNRKTAAYIFSIMKAVLDNTATNKMDFPNLQTCFVTSLTQNQKGLYPIYPFSQLFNVCVQLLNEEQNDFILEGPIVEEVLARSIPRNTPPRPLNLRGTLNIPTGPHTPRAQAPRFALGARESTSQITPVVRARAHGSSRITRNSLPISQDE